MLSLVNAYTPKRHNPPGYINLKCKKEKKLMIDHVGIGQNLANNHYNFLEPTRNWD